MSITNVFTESKALQMAACQGQFTISHTDNLAQSKLDIAVKLVDNDYLRYLGTDEGLARYSITSSGKEYLKELKGHVSKRVTPVREVAEELSLEHILVKRLQILKSAERRGLDFNLTDANVRKLLKEKVCYYTGVPFENEEGSLESRTFERVDDSKGYVHGNVVAITLRANRIKNVLLECDNDMKITVEQFIKMAEQIKKHLF